jgi:hypothetical protein
LFVVARKSHVRIPQTIYSLHRVTESSNSAYMFVLREYRCSELRLRLCWALYENSIREALVTPVVTRLLRTAEVEFATDGQSCLGVGQLSGALHQIFSLSFLPEMSFFCGAPSDEMTGL